MKRYERIEILNNEEGKRYLKNVIYPDIPLSDEDIYVITVDGDRFDTLALDFYYDATKWWIIVVANPEITSCSLNIEPGTQIRIPAEPDYYIQKYQDLNR